MSLLDELVERVNALPPDQQQELARKAAEINKEVWIPNPGPQTDAYFCKADILLFGGEPGGGKSALLVGLAMNCQEKSLLMRRQYTDLDGLTEYAIALNGSRKGFNGSAPPSLTRGPSKIDFGACTRPGDEQHWMGRPHDFLGLDEGTQFSQTQFRFLRGWLRSTNKEIRVRTVIATNPPLTAEGLWVIEMFAAWLDPTHPDPAKPGELRWYVFDENDTQIAVDGPGKHEINGKEYRAESLTYIPSGLQDNPYYDEEEYRRKLDALPAEARRILLGGFQSRLEDQPFQVIPTDWIIAAQDRWAPGPPVGVPMCAIGFDDADGGRDSAVIAARYDAWFPDLVILHGTETKDAPYKAGRIIGVRRDQCEVTVDLGGGFGAETYAHLKSNGVTSFGYNGMAPSTARTADGKLKFVNIRAEAHWRFREALDPSQPGGSPVQLPKDQGLLSDLAAPRFELTTGGIKIEEKKDIIKRLGRSPDKGDSVIMCWFRGQRGIERSVGVQRYAGSDRPEVNLGPRRARLRR